MAGTEIEWVIVQSAYASRDIGAIGFIGDTAVVAVSFFDDSDWNEDGKLSPIERVGKYIPIVGGCSSKRAAP